MSSGMQENAVQLSLLAPSDSMLSAPSSKGHIAPVRHAASSRPEGQKAWDEGARALGVGCEEHLVRLAVALGAGRCGGPLSAGERELIERARGGEPVDSRFVGEAKQAVLGGGDPLGDALCALRPASRRRADGAFYTPPAIVEAMAHWLLRHPLSRVVDPGCGSGRFAATIARRRPDLPIIAVDLDPLATLLTRAALAVIGARDALVLQADYLTLALPHGEGRTGFIANPPYVRHHDLPAEAKAWAAASGKRLNLTVSGLSGLHTLFYLATALNARPGDVGCFVTSAEWLDTRYGAAIRRLLAGRLGLQALTVFEPQAIPFADAMTTAAITCFTPGASDEDVALDVVDAPASLDLAFARRTVARRRLADTDRWSPLLRHDEQVSHRASTVPLRAVARVHRGVATGCNSFFVLSRERAAQLGLLPWCQPAITRAEEILHADGVVHDAPERRLLLVVPAAVNRRDIPALDAYLRLGEETRDGRPPVSHGYLASRRKPWWYLGPVAAPPIVASYMARQAPAFAYNPDGLVLLNVAHGIYPRYPLDEERARELARQLNAARATFRGHGRTYHGGLEKFEPREMEDLPISLEKREYAGIR